MRKAVVFLQIAMLAAMLSGCIISKTPSTDAVSMAAGEQKTFSIKVFPSNATCAWTLDTTPLSNTGSSYVYAAAEGDHVLTVTAKHIFGTDTWTWNIHVAGLVLSGTETRVTLAAADQFDPAISANLVVYTDFSGVDADVWYTDLTTGDAFPASTASGDQQLTGVSNGRVVFTDWNTMDVEVFDTMSGTTTNLTNAAGANSLDPAIGGDLVAWTDDRDGGAEIYARNLATGEERRISQDFLVDEAPAVGDGMIVWERCDGYACDVCVYDWAADTATQITHTDYASERFPDVAGRTVVFQREQGTPIDKNIVAYNLDSGVEQVLPLAGDQENAHISGGYVSYNDSASGIPHIGLWDLASGSHFTVTSNDSGQYLNDIDGNRIVYSDNRYGDLDIYLYEFQITPGN